MRGLLYYPPRKARFQKTVQTDLLATQSIAASTVVVGTPFDFSTKMGGTAGIWFGRGAATASTGSAIIRLEFSKSASGDNSWAFISEIATTIAACESEAVTGTVNAGQKVITVASTANLTAGDWILIANPTPSLSEWAQIKSIVANTSITVVDDLVNAATGCTIYDSAEIFTGIEIPAGVVRIRAVFFGALFTQASYVRVSLTTIDSIG